MVFEFRRMWMFDMSMRITLGNLFHECATRYGDRLAVTIAPSGVQISYAELETSINQSPMGFVHNSVISEITSALCWKTALNIWLPHML